MYNPRPRLFLAYQICRTDHRWVYSTMLLACSLFLVLSTQARAVDLSTMVLKIQGELAGQKNGVVELDRASLTKLNATTFTTNQPWTKEAKKYTGVRINTLLEHVGASSSDFEALASNEYRFTLQDIDFEKYPIIIAYKIDDEFVDARKLGPLLIVFPFDDHPELQTEKNKAASVWQLIEMQIL